MKFCIVGTGRCGSTLLWRMVNAHPNLFVFRETHWIPALHEAFGTRRVTTERMLDIVHRSNFVTGEQITPLDAASFRNSGWYSPEMTVRDFCDALGGYKAAWSNKTQWADKTPDYGYFTSTLQVYWPECRIIHLIRNGADTASSMAGHIGYQALAAMNRMHWCGQALDYQPPAGGFADCPAGDFADLWHDRLQRTRDEASRLRPGSYLELRYEALLTDPRQVLTELATFADLEAPASWLAQAAAMVYPQKAQARRARKVDLAPHHLALQRELGYE